MATKQNKTVEEVSLIITDRVDEDNDTTHIEASRNGRINVRKLNGKLHNIIGKAQENNIFCGADKIYVGKCHPNTTINSVRSYLERNVG